MLQVDHPRGGVSETSRVAHSGSERQGAARWAAVSYAYGVIIRHSSPVKTGCGAAGVFWMTTRDDDGLQASSGGADLGWQSHGKFCPDWQTGRQLEWWAPRRTRPRYLCSASATARLRGTARQS